MEKGIRTTYLHFYLLSFEGEFVNGESGIQGRKTVMDVGGSLLNDAYRCRRGFFLFVNVSPSVSFLLQFKLIF